MSEYSSDEQDTSNGADNGVADTDFSDDSKVTVSLHRDNRTASTDTARIPVVPGLRHAPPTASTPKVDVDLPVYYPAAEHVFAQPKFSERALKVVRYVAPKWSAPPRHSLLFYIAVVALMVVGVSGIFLMLLRLSSHGWGVILGLFFLALMPVVVIGGLVMWIDNWEREPLSLYAVAFIWGAGVSTLMSSMFNSVIDELTKKSFGETSGAVATSVLGAPLIEEAFKGIGVLLIALLFKRYFNGPVDGIVYGMLIGLGFAFTENIVYFSQYYDQLAEVFRGRAILNPFVHPFATAMTGLFVGLSTQQRSRTSMVYLAPVGYSLAVALHALHNLSVVLSVTDATRLIFQIPIYLAVLTVIVGAKVAERRNVMDALREYAKAGWITSNELSMIQTLSNRRQAVLWAQDVVSQAGGDPEDGKEAMTRFQHELIQLGYTRSRNLHRGTVNRPRNRQREANRLQLLGELRKVFTGKVAQGLS